MADSDTGPAQDGALAGLRVIEMGQLLAGPFCGQLMADFGAEVIKLEPPGKGDPMRDWGQEKPQGVSLWWSVVARNKKSVELDARQPEGQAIIRDLAARADILIENFRPGTMERWGLGYDALKAVNPRLIMIRVSGYGQTGPYAHKAGFGAIGEAMGGLRYVVGDPSTPPSRMGISIGDTLAATFACVGGLMALHARTRSGRGQMVDSAIYEAVLAVMESLVTEYDQAGYIRERTGAILPRIAPSNVYPTRGRRLRADRRQPGHGLRAPGRGDGPPGVGRRCALCHPHRPRRAPGGTGRAGVGLDPHHGPRSAGAVAGRRRVPRGDIYRAPEMLDDAHFKAREAIVSVMHPQLGALRMQNVAPRLSATPGRVRHAGPALGEHNAEILAGLLRLDPARLERLHAAGVTGRAG